MWTPPVAQNSSKLRIKVQNKNQETNAEHLVIVDSRIAQYFSFSRFLFFFIYLCFFLIPIFHYLEEDWEKELEAELQDYEMVSEQKSTNSKSDNWEKEIEDILQEADLK